ncbi:MAG: hypothetical protein ACPG77_18685, partial [Nannocystaceae bacterium]
MDTVPANHLHHGSHRLHEGCAPRRPTFELRVAEENLPRKPPNLGPTVVGRPALVGHTLTLVDTGSRKHRLAPSTAPRWRLPASSSGSPTEVPGRETGTL